MDLLEHVTDSMGSDEVKVLVAGGRTYTHGTGDGQINAAWSASARTLADGANETLNLTDASLTKRNSSTTVDFSAMKYLYIKNNFAAGNLLIGAAASTPVAIVETPASHRLTLGPGDEMGITYGAGGSGLTVSTNGSLKIEHDGSGSAAGSYDIAILGIGVYA